jgi:serine/threonine-protein kinase
MQANTTDTPAREDRLGDVLATLLEAQECGASPPPAEWLNRYPEFAAELGEFFTSQDRLRTVAEPLREVFRVDPAPTPGPSCEAAGQWFGDYELLEEIGRGGMGVVYRARQKRPDRMVALKVVRTGPDSTAEAMRRFRNEADIAGQLDHPNIVPVHEVGEHEGRVFFSMKLIAGGNLAGQLDRFRDNPRSVAALMATVARAVHHAHQRGVLHRDLKPSNILLDTSGHPYVTDFGLARRLEVDSSLTQSGALVGTPSYMAPEQASGHKPVLTTATDVYGLGAVLYALLTGRPPFQAETVLDTMLLVREREPEPPSRLNRAVDPDLETICLKCLRKDPEGRYRSAEAVAEDLDCWLRGEPITARPLTRTVRAWRWCRRNPVVAGLTGTAIVLGIALIVGLAVSNWLLARKQAETDEQWRRAEAERQRAQQNLDKAFNFMFDILAQLRRKDLDDVPRIHEIRQALIDHGLQYYQNSIRPESKQPADRFETARAYVALGTLYEARGDLAEAVRAREKAAALFEALAAEYPSDPWYLGQVGHTYNNLGLHLARMGMDQAAVEHFRRAAQAFEHHSLLFPKGSGSNNLAWMLTTCPAKEVRDPARAVQLAQHAVALAPDDANCWNTLGCSHYYAGNWRHAINACEKSIEKCPPGKADPTNWFLLAMAHWKLGEKEQARRLYEKGARWTESKGIQHPVNDRFRAEAAALLGVPIEAPSTYKKGAAGNSKAALAQSPP